MLIDALHPEETRVVIAENSQIIDFDFVSSNKKQLKGNIYLAKITRVEPSLQAAFVEYGGGKQGFLPFSEIHPDYYQIPVSDRKRLMEEAESESAQDAQEDAVPENEGNNASSDEQNNADDTNDSEQLEFTDSTQPALPLAPAIEQLPETSEQSSYQSESSDAPFVSELAPMSEPTGDVVENAPEMPVSDNDNNAETKADEAPASEPVETLQSDEEEIQSRPKRNVFSRRYKIQEVIRRGQVVLVQVIKEERGNKGASLTTYLSLAGRYCVLMPNSPKDGGISRKIASSDDRKRLKAISTELRLAAGMSVIIRTAGTDRTRAEIKRDYDYLVKVWNRVREVTLESNAPALIYEESDVIKRAIRDQYTNDTDEVIIEGDEGYKAAKDFMKLLLPSHTPKIKHYKEATPLFYAYNIEEQLLSMHDPIVKLRSGGYIVINPTEALISIDVNSGRATGERNIEETATKTNLEAAAEVARQLRLRDLAGLIVIDFIDMLESRNRRAVEKAIKDALKVDRAKIQLGRISPFGLLEMSRQRLRPSIAETNMIQCPHCIGRGLIRSNESMSIQMIRALEKEASSGQWSSLRLLVPQALALHLLNFKREALQTLEERHNLTVQVLIDVALAESDFNLEKMRRTGQSERGAPSGDGRGRNRRPERNRNDNPRAAIAETVLEEMSNAEEEIAFVDEPAREPANTEEGFDSNREPRRGGRNRRGRRGQRRSGGGRFRENNEPRPNTGNIELASNDNASDMLEVATDVMPIESNDSNAPANPRRRERGGRGRGRKHWRDDKSDAGSNRPDNNAVNAAPQEAGNAPVEAKLPAFTKQEPVLIEPTPVFHDRKPAAAPQPISAPRDPNKAAKKGWWQKMIELE
jgi:ribonuclease E